MSPQSGFNQPSQNNQFGQRGRTPAAAPAQAAGGCTSSAQPCVDLLINNAPYSVSSVLAAVELVLKMQLEGQRIFSLTGQPNDASGSEGFRFRLIGHLAHVLAEDWSCFFGIEEEKLLIVTSTPRRGYLPIFFKYLTYSSTKIENYYL